MNLYNSLSKKVEDFTPLKDGEISIYSCGPTVYDRAHIGNLASFIYADLLKRTLALSFPDAEIKHVMNLTDVDDKTIKRSQEAYPDLEPMVALAKLTQHYEKLFMGDLEAVGIDTGKIDFVRATDYIPQMQQLISELVASGIGYIADDGVYFSIAKYKQAGKKYGQLVEITSESTGAARVNNDEYDKDNVHDFALWKKQKPGEPVWDFQLNGQDLIGRPGWHIECSAMSAAKLGKPFDIHTGGVDLKFPHHENEIAQSTANGNENYLAKSFFHSEHVLVDNQKMSKSLNNFYTLEDIEAKGYDPLAFRLLVLQSSYRNQAHFSWDNLDAAQNRLKEFQALADLRWQARTRNSDSTTYILGGIPSVIASILADDMNAAAALEKLNDAFSQASAVQIDADESNPYNSISQFSKMLSGIDDLLGLGLSQRADISSDKKKLIAERETARNDKNWKSSDELRDQLTGQGIGLNDTPNGAVWYRL